MQSHITAFDGELQKVASLAATISGSVAPAPQRHPFSESRLAVARNGHNGSHDAHVEQWQALERLGGTLTQLANNLSRPAGRKSPPACDAGSPT
jgi:hypothetical protein